MDSTAVAIALHHLSVLDLHPGTSLEDIKRRHRHLALLFHPDRLSADTAPEVRALAEAKIREINAAAEWLCDHIELVHALDGARQDGGAVDDEIRSFAIACPACRRGGHVRDPRDGQVLRCRCGAIFCVRYDANRGWFTERFEPASGMQTDKADDAADGPEDPEEASADSSHTPASSLWTIGAIATVLVAGALIKTLATNPSPPTSPISRPAATTAEQGITSATAPTPGMQPPARKVTFRYVSSRGGANVREGPGTTYAPVHTIPYGGLVALGIDQREEWVFVEWFDDVQPIAGWVWRPLLSDSPPDMADGREIWRDQPGTFRLGSSKIQVLETQGEPEEFGASEWQYGDSWVAFAGGRVTDYRSHFTSPLTVSLIPKGPIQGQTFTLGSSALEVAGVQGTPSEVSGSFWGYDLSSVTFDEDGRVESFQNLSNNLRIDPAVVTVPAVGTVVEFLDPSEGVYNAGVVLAADPRTVRIAEEHTGRVRELNTSAVFAMTR